ncbi:hypothetical protein D9619_006080 [Psilocybe cf. subviscida]|uniref:Uncharacterized protein n=1 Tax=Psilocybe cf. subviscida TaxID=2480587 RepID=A0A8H5FB82_9AGAR|nr:hypothetical protein D9619_006080 [Psilocybe cf. subviscida]
MMSREGGNQLVGIQSTNQRPLPTITHDITEFAKWPLGAKPVVDLLCRPLTATIADLSRMPGPGWPREAWTRVLEEQGVSVGASHSGGGAGEAGPSSRLPVGPGLAHISTQPSPMTGSRERLITDPRIFDALWAHTERMRMVAATMQVTPSAVGAVTPAEKMPTRPGWTALMKQLLEASVSREESILWHNTPFVLPRPNRLGATIPPARNCQDEAAMLFVTHIQELLITSSTEGSTQRDTPRQQSPLKQQNPNMPPAPRSPAKKEEEFPTGSPARYSVNGKSAQVDGASHANERSEEWSSESDEIISTINSEVEILKLDVSQDGHIIPGGVDSQRTCVLPIVCVAGDGPGLANITSQITSVACQRYVWGIRQPTLGIEMADSGYHARIFVAWVQEDELTPLVKTPLSATKPSQIPSSVGLTGPGMAGPPPNMKRVVHIARASTSAPCNPTLGFFNLSLPSHMLLFAQFILGAARAQYDGIVASTMSYADYEDRVPIWRRKFCWRSDHGAVTGEMHDMMPTDNTLEGRIRKWAEEVEVYRRMEASNPKGKTKRKDTKEGTTARRQRRATSRPL